MSGRCFHTISSSFRHKKVRDTEDKNERSVFSYHFRIVRTWMKKSQVCCRLCWCLFNAARFFENQDQTISYHRLFFILFGLVLTASLSVNRTIIQEKQEYLLDSRQFCNIVKKTFT